MFHSNNLLTSTVIRQWKQMRFVLGDGDSRVDLDGLNLDIAQIICIARSVSQTSTVTEVNGSFAATIA